MVGGGKESACADPESFVRGGPALTTFYEDKYHPKQAWPNIQCWLVSFVIFQGIRTSIAKEPYSVGGGGGPDAHCQSPPLWIRTWTAYVLLSGCVD